MTEQDLVTCHCIIGHPSKPKFLVIKHKKGWAPPVLMFEPGFIDYRAEMISFGMMQKYGLNTRVLRPLMATPRYHCVELELPEQAQNEGLRAVWVDIDDYSKFRGVRDGKKDIFEDWLKQAAKREVPAQRSPWQQAGWFDKADAWIREQFAEMDIKVTGEVQQYRVGWNASCLLTVPTEKGRYFFKAAYAKPPAEARLTKALSAAWPEHVISPLAVHEENNWMLNADYTREGTLRPGPEVVPDFASAMAKIQIAAAENLEHWKQLGCPQHGLDYLDENIAQKDQFLPHFLVGENRLTDAELRQFARALEQCMQACDQLKTLELPDTLVHRDFRVDNLVRQGDSSFITDWADTVIGQPFFLLDHFYMGQTSELLAMDAVDATAQAVKEAYLAGWEHRLSPEKVQQAFQLAHGLFPLWRLCHAFEEIGWVETDSPRYWHFQSLVQLLARNMIASSQQSPD